MSTDTRDFCPACRLPPHTCVTHLNAAAHRAALTRALTAQAWAVACVVYAVGPANDNPYRYDSDEESGIDKGVERVRDVLADLDSPVELAAEILGDA